MIEQVSQQQPATESHHLPHRTEIPLQCGMPLRKHPIQRRVYGHINQCLRSQAPIGKPIVGQNDTRHAGYSERNEIRKRAFAHSHRFKQSCARNNAQARDDERQKQVARQGNDFLVFEKSGDERCRSKKHRIERHTQRQAKPKHRIVIAMLHRRPVRQRRREPAFLNRRSNQREDGQLPHHAIVGRREHTRQPDAEHKCQHLLCAVAQGTPEQSARGFFFEGGL